MKILVTGGRRFDERAVVWGALDALRSTHAPEELTIIHGGATGADALAQAWCESRGVACTAFKAEWARLGSRAGIVRNKQMLVEGRPDLVLAFPGGPGTKNMVERALKAGVPVRRFDSAPHADARTGA